LVSRAWNGLIWLRRGTCLAVMTEGNFLSEDLLVLKKDSAPFNWLISLFLCLFRSICLCHKSRLPSSDLLRFVYTRKCLKDGQFVFAWCVALRPPQTVTEVRNERHFRH
jgi:hypothetical protein